VFFNGVLSLGINDAVTEVDCTPSFLIACYRSHKKSFLKIYYLLVKLISVHNLDSDIYHSSDEVRQSCGFESN
jgi:hypothetical protein